MVKYLLSLLVLVAIRSPIVSATELQTTPEAGSCEVQHRTVAEVNELASQGTPPIIATPIFDEATPYARPEGAPISGATVDGVTATVQEFVDCINSGEFLGFLALLSDDFILTNAEDLDLPVSEGDPALTPSPNAGEDVIVVANIADMVELPDSRVNALVVWAISVDESDDPNESEDFVDWIPIQMTLIYDENRERWMIDEFQVVQTAEAGPTAWTQVQGEGYEGVIASEEGARQLTDFYVGGAPIEDFWSPTIEDVAALESSLPAYLQSVVVNVSGVGPGFLDRLPDYKRQYAGFVQSGRRLILVNATCMSSINWQTQPLVVLDGGDCFFRIVYDPGAGTFESFEVNAEG